MIKLYYSIRAFEDADTKHEVFIRIIYFLGKEPDYLHSFLSFNNKLSQYKSAGWNSSANIFQPLANVFVMLLLKGKVLIKKILLRFFKCYYLL